MKLLIAAITFAVTLGMLFLIEAGESPKEDYAQVIEALKEGSVVAATSVTPAPIKTRVPTPTTTSTPTHIPAPTPSPAPQNSPVTRQTTATPTPAQTPAKTPSPTPSPFSQPSSPAISTPTPAPVTIPSSTPQPMPEQSGKVNINTASVEELDNITGVGPAIGQRIIDYRNTNGPFQKIEDIINVKGIGDKTFEKMKNEITI